MSHFWTGGPKAYEKGLLQQFRTEIAELQQRLQAAQTNDEIQRLEKQIRQVTQQHAEKLRAIDDCLF